MKFSMLLAAAAAVTLAAGPAYANAHAAPTRGAQVRYDARRDVYCIKDARDEVSTGTRIPSIQCLRAAEWARQGVILDRRPR